MATTATHHDPSPDLIDRLEEFIQTYCHDGLLELANEFPNDSRSLAIGFEDLYRFDHDVALDVLDQPRIMLGHLERALADAAIPVDRDLEGAHVRVHGLGETETYHPGEASPSAQQGRYLAIRGEIAKVSDVYSELREAHYECQVCGIVTEVPQPGRGDAREPIECSGCERQGPFDLDPDQSEFVDAQKLRIAEPPELAEGAGQTVDAYLRDDLVDAASIGDRVTVSGILELAETSGRAGPDGPNFEHFLTAKHVAIDETDRRELDVDDEERARIEALASGAEGDPLAVAADSLVPEFHGYDAVKRALILAMVSGGSIGQGAGNRATINVLLLGDPSTGKSMLMDAVADVGWRTISISSTRASKAGLLASAEHDDFGDSGWTLKAGALVRAHGGAICIDEFDDMDRDAQAALNEPMSKQEFSVSLAGEQVTFRTETSVLAAANPRDGRFDRYEPIAEQFDFPAALLSRFDLIFTFMDDPDDSDTDQAVATHKLEARDARKRQQRGDDLDADARARIEGPVDRDTLSKWLAFAKQRDPPPFASDEVRDMLKEPFLELRQATSSQDDGRVAVTRRKLEDLIRLAEAAAKLELDDVIEQRHVETANAIVRESMADVGRDSQGNLDADIVEQGRSRTQHDRIEEVRRAIEAVTGEDDGPGADREAAIDEAVERTGATRGRIDSDIENLVQRGEVSEPSTGRVRYLGRV